MATTAKSVKKESAASLPVTDNVNVLTEMSAKARVSNKDAANDNNFNDLFEIGATTKVIPIPTGRKSKREKEVEDTVKHCDLLAEKHSKYNDDYIVRGNQALYELLADIYKIALALDKSDYKHEIHSKMRKILKDRDIKVQTNTPDLTLLVKYVVGSDRKRATNYSRILKIALTEGLAAEELASYISRRGGIGQIHETEANSVAKEMGTKMTKERLELMKEYLLLTQWEDPVEFKYDKAILQHNDDKQTKSETATFAVFLADYDHDKKVYRVISGHDLGRTYEDCVLRFIIKSATGDVSKIKAGITRYKKMLLEKNLVPKNWKTSLENDLSKSS